MWAGNNAMQLIELCARFVTMLTAWDFSGQSFLKICCSGKGENVQLSAGLHSDQVVALSSAANLHLMPMAVSIHNIPIT